MMMRRRPSRVHRDRGHAVTRSRGHAVTRSAVRGHRLGQRRPPPPPAGPGHPSRLSDPSRFGCPSRLGNPSRPGVRSRRAAARRRRLPAAALPPGRPSQVCSSESGSARFPAPAERFSGQWRQGARAGAAETEVGAAIEARDEGRADATRPQPASRLLQVDCESRPCVQRARANNHACTHACTHARARPPARPPARAHART
jgi:hypothetical protein